METETGEGYAELSSVSDISEADTSDMSVTSVVTLSTLTAVSSLTGAAVKLSAGAVVPVTISFSFKGFTSFASYFSFQLCVLLQAAEYIFFLLYRVSPFHLEDIPYAAADWKHRTLQR